MTTRRLDVSGPGFSDDDSPPASNLSSMQRAIVTIQKMRAKIEQLERTRTEPVAIIGMACRIPGGVNTPEAFFRLLDDGVDTVREIPADRWHVEMDGPNTEGEARALRWGSFLNNVDMFDAAFFGISPREAESLDPQQRLLLEVTWEALERAGQLPERLMGTKTGVFVGIWAPDYQLRILARDPAEIDAYGFTGTLLSTAAGRLSYTLGAQGPCMSIDTACSSSLTAIHLASQSLRNGESTMAIAGGVNLMLAPSTTHLLSKTHALSPDGRCKTFDARANGYVRGEGCGMLVLKRLSDAERDGDTILALIRGSAVNQDGRSSGLTAPNVLSQQALLKQALESARLSPQDISYLETHGTGTSLGDPIEVDAIKAVFGAPRERGAKCVLGALKSNIGHLEAAAGVAGVIKAVLALQHEKIPANLHFRSLNPRIDLSDTSLEIAQSAKPWTSGVRQRYAGISSFGISGTNAHVILEEAPRNLEEALLEEEISSVLLPISAKTHEALRMHARAFRDMLRLESGLRLVDIVHTASVRRSHHLHRLSVVGRTKDELADSLDAYLENRPTVNVTEGKSSPARAKIVFVFSGQGAQWLGMGRQLYATDASFRSVIDTCDNLMTSRLGWSILDEFDAPETMARMTETQVAQPLLFALQVALVEMLRSWGISPDAMIGHGAGEIAAAHVAGILSLDEAIRLVSIRGRIMQKSAGMGKMVSVAASAEAVRAMLAGQEERIAIAAIDDPESVVVSGSALAIDDLIARCEKRGVSTQMARVDYAFQSPNMEPFKDELVERLARVDTRRATLAMYSTVLGDCVDGKELDVHYWGRNVRQTVDFSGAVTAAIRDGYQLFLELSPHPTLGQHIRRCLVAKNADGHAVSTLEKGREDRLALLKAAGALYTRGCAVEWARITPSGGRCAPVPTYPFQRERFWIHTVESTGRRPPIGQRSTTSRARIVFVFPGQGSQWIGMGRQLLTEERIFRETLEACDDAIQKEAGFSVLAELEADELTARFDEIDVVQPLLFAVEVALAALWRSKGIVPDCVVGHSMGEVAAAHVAGMLTLNDAVRVICRRSRLLKRISGQGAMASVELPIAEAAVALQGFEAKLSIAVSNGPRSTVLSGESAALDSVLKTLEAKGVFCRRIKVDVASHSPQVEPLREDLLTELRDVQAMAGLLRMQSTVAGRTSNAFKPDAEYWWDNLRNPVLFSSVVESLVDNGPAIFVEVSPHPILMPAIEEHGTTELRSVVTIASMRRSSDESQGFADALKQLLARQQTAERSSATSKWTREPPEMHPLLGSRIDVPTTPRTIFWRQNLDLKVLPWLVGHQINNNIILPGAVIIEAILAAAQDAFHEETVVVEDLTFMAPVYLEASSKLTIGLTLTATASDDWNVLFSSLPEHDRINDPPQWQVHATARVLRQAIAKPSEHSPGATQNLCPNNVPLDEFAQQQRAIGLTTTEAFEAITSLSRSRQQSLARLRIPNGALSEQAYFIHPTLVDAGLRVAILATGEHAPNQPLVLAKIERIQFYRRAGREAWSIGNIRTGQQGGKPDETSLRVVDDFGHVFIAIDGIQTQTLKSLGNLLTRFSVDLRWDELPLPATLNSNNAIGQWLILCDEVGIGQLLGGKLTALGGKVRYAHRKFANASTLRQTEIDPQNAEEMRALMVDTFPTGTKARGIIHLWGLDSTTPSDSSTAAFDSVFLQGCGAALHLVQGLEQVRARDKPRLWLATRGSQHIDAKPGPVLPTQAPLWGLGRTIALESPDARCVRMDLDAVHSDDDASLILREILADGEEEEIAFRHDRRFVSRIGSNATRTPATPVSIHGNASYMITGGLGGVGLFCAKSLVAAGARHLILVGRSGITSTEQHDAIDALRKVGAVIEIMNADVADFAQLSAVFAQIELQFPPLRGILHAAGVLDDGMLATQTFERFRRVFAPKILGGWNLHQLTKTRPLDFLIFFSSVTSVLGAPGLGNYVAANAFLDALAHYRQQSKQVGASINWGPLGELGMAVKAERLGMTSRHGIRSFTSSETESLLLEVLGEKRCQVVVVDIDFRQWLESYPQISGSPRFGLVRGPRNDKTTRSHEPSNNLFDSLKQMSPRNRLTTVEEHVRKHLAAILRMQESRIERNQPLRALGIDSLMGMELRNRLENAFGLRLSATLIYAYPTVAAITEYLVGIFAEKSAPEPSNEDKPKDVEKTPVEIADAPKTDRSGGGPRDDLLALFDQTMAELEAK